ncbi:hypothetical protein J6590_086490, partial [Homalodisca vitripennis]
RILLTKRQNNQCLETCMVYYMSVVGESATSQGRGAREICGRKSLHRRSLRHSDMD